MLLSAFQSCYLFSWPPPPSAATKPRGRRAAALAVSLPSLGTGARVCRKRSVSPQPGPDSWLSFLDFRQSFKNCHPKDALNLMGNVNKARGGEGRRRLWKEITCCKTLVLCSQGCHGHGLMGKCVDGCSLHPNHVYL